MKELINTYKEHREDIESFMINTLKNNGKIHGDEVECYKENFKSFPSMELLYITNEAFEQLTPNIFRNKVFDEAVGRNRTYLAKQLVQQAHQFSFSEQCWQSANG